MLLTIKLLIIVIIPLMDSFYFGMKIMVIFLVKKIGLKKKAKKKVVAPIIRLPFAMDCKAAIEMVWSWLLEQPEEKYQDYMDHDGSNGKGFKIYNEYWGHVGSSHYAICAVLPIWSWYGK